MTALKTLPENPDRRTYIGSSNIAGILGLSKWQTPYDVYSAKVAPSQEEMDPAKKKFLERRKRWEPVVVEMLREELEAKIVATNLRYVDPEFDFFAAEIDAEAQEEDGEIINVEIKTVSPRAWGEKFGWGEPGSGDIPIDYEAQVQFALGVTGRKVAAVAAMVGLDDMIFYRIERDDELIADLRARAVKFWHENVLAKVAPEPTTIADLHKMYKTSDETIIVQADDVLGSTALKLRGIRHQIAAWETQAEALEFDVKLGMKKAETLVVDGRKVFTWKETKFSMLDQTSLKEKEPKVHKQFTLSGTRRVFKHLSS